MTERWFAFVIRVTAALCNVVMLRPNLACVAT